MKNFSDIVSRVIYESDIVLLIIDGRNIEDSINKNLESKIRNMRKRHIYVINKCDLLTEEEIKGTILPNSIKISAMNHIGTRSLVRKIMEISHGKEVTVGVVGFPNTGKSTVINALKGKHSAPTSPISGFTRGIQKIRISSKILMLDTPGVLSYDKDKAMSMVQIGAISDDKFRDPELVAMRLIEKMEGRIEGYFEVEACSFEQDSEQTLEKIALKKHILKKGGMPDITRMAKEVIRMCQKGKIR